MRERREEGARPRSQVPLATYRLQFNRQFGFRQAAQVTAYLHDLGVSDLYASPLLEAKPDSTHGYDVCDSERINPNLGSKAEFESFARRLRESGTGLLLDIVPNHMAADCANGWWLDVLAKGPRSQYAQWFDVNWRPLNPDLQNKVLLPVLEDHYANVLESGKLRLVNLGSLCPGGSDSQVGAPEFGIRYHDKTFPLSPESSTMLAKEASEFGLDATLKRFNGAPGVARSFDPLHELLEKQHYRLAFWRTALEEINYRRFFDVAELVSLRMESAAVFEATHKLVFKWLQEGKVTGLRIDHPDGLWDPQQYFERLSQQSSTQGSQPFIVAEKILTGDESLPGDWPIDGTTGYDFLNRVNRLFLNPANQDSLDHIYRKFTAASESFASFVCRGKRKVLQTSFISEFNALAWTLQRIAAMSRYGKDFTFRQLATALQELIVCFPVYRTYVTLDTIRLREAERESIRQVFEAVRRDAARVEPALWQFLENLFLLRPPEDLGSACSKLSREFIMRFQQLTGPVMAKGVEDTAYYNYYRLISMNEVGGDPDTFSGGTVAFHEYNQRQAAQWPHSLLATATHDTKRGEDFRARINVLSELPDEWRVSVEDWRCLNANKKQILNGKPAPDSNDEYLLYQTLVGAWPADAETADGLKLFRDRLSAYMLKAAREAKAHTNWTSPNDAYEEATKSFVEQVLDSSGENAFLGAFRPFQRKVAFFGRFNSLSQVLLKVTSPGVPDFYQGTELWDLSLVDPDNRRPVDFNLRKRLLNQFMHRFACDSRQRNSLLQEVVSEDQIGLSKLFLIWRALQFRRQYYDVFTHGEYIPLQVIGPRYEHVCAFLRKHSDHATITIIPRLVATLTGGQMRELDSEDWQDTDVCLPNTGAHMQYQNVLTAEKLALTERDGTMRLNVHDALASFPVALVGSIGA